MDLALPMADMRLQGACCVQALAPLILKAAILFSVYFQCQISALQGMIWSGEKGADNECNLAAAAVRPVPQVQDFLCQWGN